MNEPQNIFTPSGGPPQVPLPSAEIYRIMGKDGIFAMIADFYQLLAQSSIRALFPNAPDGLQAASQRSAAFFVQVCGGPQLYAEQYGPPRLRARHLPFPIDETAKGVWLQCFSQVLADADTRYGFPLEHMDGFVSWLTGFAAWMVNTEK